SFLSQGIGRQLRIEHGGGKLVLKERLTQNIVRRNRGKGGCGLIPVQDTQLIVKGDKPKWRVCRKCVQDQLAYVFHSLLLCFQTSRKPVYRAPVAQHRSDRSRELGKIHRFENVTIDTKSVAGVDTIAFIT